MNRMIPAQLQNTETLHKGLITNWPAITALEVFHVTQACMSLVLAQWPQTHELATDSQTRHRPTNPPRLSQTSLHLPVPTVALSHHHTQQWLHIYHHTNTCHTFNYHTQNPRKLSCTPTTTSNHYHRFHPVYYLIWHPTDTPSPSPNIFFWDSEILQEKADLAHCRRIVR